MQHKPKKYFDFVRSVSSPCQREVSLSLVHALLVSKEIVHATSTKVTIVSETPSGGILF